ncbi:hypothetical protein [Tabrizicola sp.]|uniref:hypothetical protein n=1 Tax=Tabrizicola sp. TaxID=2005166 RepID=UPI00286AF29C|nr:hypothetical protein [Tabrizicola sp.]
MQNSQSNDGPVMEVVRFRLKAGNAEAAFLNAAKATETPLRAQRGFVRRALTRAEDGFWTDHVIWSSMAMAGAGADAMMAEPAFQPFMAMIDGPTVSMRHDRIHWQMD